MNTFTDNNIKKVPFSVSLVIPLYNNAKSAKKLLEECIEILKKFSRKYEIVLCNDGSFDETAEVIHAFAKKNKHVRIITHKKNLGITASLKDLYSNARNKYILLFSVDGGWNPLDIAHLLVSANKKNTDIVIGKRKKKKYNYYRKFISIMYNILPLVLFGTKTYDTGSIKIFKSEIFKEMTFTSKGIFFEAELLIKAKRRGYSIKAIPVSHKRSNHKVKSGVNLLEIKKAIVDMIKLRFDFS